MITYSKVSLWLYLNEQLGSLLVDLAHQLSFRVPAGQGKLEKVREFEWSGKVREKYFFGKVREKSGKMRYMLGFRTDAKSVLIAVCKKLVQKTPIKYPVARSLSFWILAAWLLLLNTVEP